MDVDCSVSLTADEACQLVPNFVPGLLSNAAGKTFKQCVLQVTDTRMPHDKKDDLVIEFNDGVNLVDVRWLKSAGRLAHEAPAVYSFVRLNLLRHNTDNNTWLFDKWSQALTINKEVAIDFSSAVGEPTKKNTRTVAAAAAAKPPVSTKRSVEVLRADDGEEDDNATGTGIAASSAAKKRDTNGIAALPVCFADHARVTVDTLNKSHAAMQYVLGPLDVHVIEKQDRNGRRVSKPDVYVLTDASCNASIAAKSWDTAVAAELKQGASVFVGSPMKVMDVDPKYARKDTRRDIELTLDKNTLISVVRAGADDSGGGAATAATNTTHTLALKGAHTGCQPLKVFIDSTAERYEAPLTVAVLAVSACTMNKTGKCEIRTFDVCDSSGSAAIRVIGNIRKDSPMAEWFADADPATWKKPLKFTLDTAPVVLFNPAKAETNQYGHSIAVLTWESTIDTAPNTLYATNVRAWIRSQVSSGAASSGDLLASGARVMTVDEALKSTESMDNVMISAVVPHVSAVDVNHDGKGYGRYVYLFDQSVADYDESKQYRIRVKNDMCRIEGLTVNNPDMAPSLSVEDAADYYDGAIDAHPDSAVVLRLRRAKIFIPPEGNGAYITVSPATEFTVFRDDTDEAMLERERELLHWYRAGGYTSFKQPRIFYKNSQYSSVYDANVAASSSSSAAAAAAAAAAPVLMVPDLSNMDFDDDDDAKPALAPL